mmetsp:Transcript_150829/g.484733  ORF Transcript_150829/g.484733 Transcript_150829/m.484733 type:complete len:234 (-) Transcript_150829:545-1246(-)
MRPLERGTLALAREERHSGRGKDWCLELPAVVPPLDLPIRPRGGRDRLAMALVPHVALHIPTLLRRGRPNRRRLKHSPIGLHATGAAPPTAGHFRVALGKQVDPGGQNYEEELQRQQGVAPCSVSETPALKPMLTRQAVQRAVGQLVPKLVAAGAKVRERVVKASGVLRQLFSREHPQKVAEVVKPSEGDPPRRARMPADEVRGCQALTKHGSLDALRLVAWKVNTSLTQKGD